MSRTGGMKYIHLWPADAIAYLHRTGENAETFGVRVILWCISADEVPPGTLPNDDLVLARVAMLGHQRWKKVKAGVVSGWTLNEETNRWEIRRVMDQASRMQAVSEKRASAGRMGGIQANAKQMLSKCKANDVSPEQAIAKQKLRQVNSISSIKAASPRCVSVDPALIDLPTFKEYWTQLSTNGKAHGKTKAEAAEMWPDFIRWYASYPNKTGKVKAWGAWIKLAPPEDRARAEVARQIAEVWVEDDKGWAPKVPHPATWLNGMRWQDEAGAEMAEKVPRHMRGFVNLMRSEVDGRKDIEI